MDKSYRVAATLSGEAHLTINKPPEEIAERKSGGHEHDHQDKFIKFVHDVPAYAATRRSAAHSSSNLPTKSFTEISVPYRLIPSANFASEIYR